MTTTFGKINPSLQALDVASKQLWRAQVSRFGVRAMFLAAVYTYRIKSF